MRFICKMTIIKVMQIKIQTGTKIKQLQVEQGQTILEVLQADGDTEISAPCGGRGRCGKCTVNVVGRGDVLACMTEVQEGMQVQLPANWSGEQQSMILENGFGYRFSIDRLDGVVAACDIGTTTVVCHLIDGRTGKRLATRGEPNAQRSYGADVISRIQAAVSGSFAALTRQIRGQIHHMLEDMMRQIDFSGRIERLAVAGNTVMCHLFAGIDPASIGVFPFYPEEYFGKEYSGEELGLSCCTAVYIAPAVAGFVGGDITSDLLSVIPEHEKEETLLLDIGTNGEMALGQDGDFLCCATAAGCAFEGAEIMMGMPAMTGAVSHVWLDARRIRTEIIGDTKAEGICGSGLFDALAVLLSMGLVDCEGSIRNPGDVSVAYRRYLGTYKGQPAVWITPEVCLTQADIRNLQLAKAAFAAGIEILMTERGISAQQIKRVLLAGGFGMYLNKESAAAIGLFPKELLPVTVSVGNVAGEGAVQEALSKEARRKVEHLRTGMRYMELSTCEAFSDCYMKNMGFEQ